ncbi:MAG: hypothetical protein AB1499_00580 [Nitrospirota bacterium]
MHLKTDHRISAGGKILRHLLAGAICAAVSTAVMWVIISWMSVTAPDVRERIIIMAFWISVGAFMAGAFMGFGRRDHEGALGYFPSLIIAALAGILFGFVLYRAFLFLGLSVYDGDLSSVWLLLGTGTLFGVIGWGNVLGWISAKKTGTKDSPPR